jgi:type III secretion protein T
MLAALPRVGAAITAAPLFPASLFPTLLRSSMAVMLSLFLYPHLAAHLPPVMGALMWLAWVGKEAFLGSLIGLAVGTLIWALESVGGMMDFQVGWSNAQLFDPFGGHDAGPLSTLMGRLGLTLFVVAGGLQVFFSLLFESFRLWPTESFYPPLGGRLAQFAGAWGGSLLEMVVRLATPAILLLVMIDLGFGLVNRVVPQLNVYYFTMPIKAVVVALMITLYLSYLNETVVDQMSGLQHVLERLQAVFSIH